MYPVSQKDWQVRALLANQRSTLRLPVKPQPLNVLHDGKIFKENGERFILAENDSGAPEQIAIPYRPGQILYVCERWCKDPYRYLYRADYQTDEKFYLPWRSPTIMPRRAVRIFLRVTDVCVERLQSITFNDCIAEGISNEDIMERDALHPDSAARRLFRTRWDEDIPAKERSVYAWEKDPWVIKLRVERASMEDADV